MIPYFIKSAICLLLLLAFYQLFLEREKMHQFNRFYLLGSVLFSFLVPFYTIYTEVSPSVLEISTKQQTVLEPITISSEIIETTPVNYMFIFMSLYVLVSVVLAFRFSRNLVQIIQKIRKSSSVNYQKATLVLVTDTILPHTFLHYIFINKKEYETGKIETELFTHELTHVTQKHTIDVLLIEVLQIVFWINPIFLFLKKAIKLNHEFLADNEVIASHNNISEYQSLLVNKAAWNNEFYLASNLNYSLTKKRLLMMKKQHSKTKILFKKLAILPLLAGFVLLFANRVEAQEKIISTEDEKPVKAFKDKTDEQLYKEYYFRNGKISVKDKNGKHVLKKFKDLTEIEKQKVIPPPPIIQQKKIPTIKQLNNFKSKSKYAIWIDGKVVKNTILNNYNNTDFSNFFDSFVYKNARSKRFPQKHQVHLTTNAYFKKKNIENVKAFEKFKKEHKIYPLLKRNLETSIKKVTTKYQQTKPTFHKNGFITIDGKKYYYAMVNNTWSYYLNGKKVNLNILKEYKKKYFTYLSLKSTEKHYVFKNKQEQEKIDILFSDLGGMYFRMSRAQKNRVPYPENQLGKYVKLWKNGTSFYKKRNELTLEDKKLLPPPPPPPNASKEDIIKFKKRYKNWKKRAGIMNPPPPPKMESNDKQELKPKLIVTNSLTSKEVVFTFDKKKLNAFNKENKKNNYFLDDILVSKEELNKLSPNKIAKVSIKKNKDGSKSMYITSRKK